MKLTLYSNCRLTKEYNEVIEPSYLEGYLASLSSVVYENEDESFYDKTKHYIDVYAVNDGIFIQYYLKQYNGDFFSTYTHTVYQLYYHQITDRFYYDVKTTTSELDSIIPIDFENFILPEFMYVFDDK